MIFRFLNHILNLFFPKQCFLCHKPFLQDGLLCFECLSTRSLLPTIKLGVGKDFGIKVYSLFLYKPPFNKIILSKFFFDKSLLVLSANLVPIIFRELKASGAFFNSVLIPIPIHWQRRLWRGFNQTEVFADQLGKLLLLPSLKILKRNKKTEFQSNLDPAARRLNVRNAFFLDPKDGEFIRGKKVFLIDDLCTTGATLVAAARVLKKFSPLEICAIVICR